MLNDLKQIIENRKLKVKKTKSKKTKQTKKKISKSLKKHYKEHPRRTKKIGNKLTDIKKSDIVEGRLNQIIVKYKLNKKTFEVSVIVKNFKDLNKKIRLLGNKSWERYETRKSKLKISSVNRYLVKKRKKKK